MPLSQGAAAPGAVVVYGGDRVAAALVALACVAAFALLGSRIGTKIDGLADTINTGQAQ